MQLKQSNPSWLLVSTAQMSLHIHVYSYIILNTQDMETGFMSINARMHKETTTPISREHYVKLNKQGSERQISHLPLYQEPVFKFR